MVILYRAGAILLFLFTLAAVTHDTQILRYLFAEQPATQAPTNTQQPKTVKDSDKFKEF